MRLGRAGGGAIGDAAGSTTRVIGRGSGAVEGFRGSRRPDQAPHKPGMRSDAADMSSRWSAVEDLHPVSSGSAVGIGGNPMAVAINSAVTMPGSANCVSTEG